MKISPLLSAVVTTLVFSVPALAASVAFVEPVNGATVPTTFRVRFSVDGMEVKPAGEISDTSGHHHLIINGTGIPAGAAVPFDETHIHFGKGQTEATVTVRPGTYTLTLQFANGAHLSYGEPLSKTITVNVK